MTVVTQDAVADIVVVRSLNMVKKDHVLELDTVSDDTVGTDNC